MIWLRKHGQKLVEVIATAIAILLIAFGISVMVRTASGFSLKLPSGWNQSTEALLAVENPVQSDFTQETANITATDTLINALARCESGNRWDIKILDSNNEYSYSGLQFQAKTFYSFGIAYKILPKDFPFYETENRIYEKETQIAIAKKMIEAGIAKDHWKTCWKRINETHPLK